MSGTASTQERVREAVARYAAAVRRHLGDLPPDLVEDLTDGLEADLVDALEDGAALPAGAVVDLDDRFGEPGAYAAELRAAAGLPDAVPARAPRPWPDGLARAGGAAAGAWRRTRAVVARQPWAAPVARAAADLRPLWWVARAWVLYQVVMWLAAEWSVLPRLVRPERDGVPGSARHWALLLVLAVVSVQWGRGRWGAGQLPRLSRALTVVALLLALPVAVFTWESRYYAPVAATVQYVEVPVELPGPQDGVWVDGMQVSNLFVYDAEGDPLSGVQVYDDRGRAVRTTTDEGLGSWTFPGVDEPWTFVPSWDEDGRARWNVYPLQGAPTDEFAFSGEPGVAPELTGEPRTPPRPFAKAPAVQPGATPAEDSGAGDRGPGPTPGATASAAPTAGS